MSSIFIHNFCKFQLCDFPYVSVNISCYPTSYVMTYPFMDKAYGEIQSKMDKNEIWKESQPTKQLIPAIFVLDAITRNIDGILRSIKIPVSPTSDYAYINDVKNRYPGKKEYFSSYQELLQLLKQAKYEPVSKILDADTIRVNKLRTTLSRLSPLEKITIECYARFEEELINYTSDLLMIDKEGNPVENFRKDYYFKNDPRYQLRYADVNTYVDREDFKDHITSNFEYQSE